MRRRSQSLGEHGVHYNHFGLHEEVARVPLILNFPRRWLVRGGSPIVRPSIRRPRTWNAKRLLCGRKAAAEVMTIDIAPTLLELAGLPASPTHRGRSLAETWRTGSEPEAVAPLRAGSVS